MTHSRNSTEAQMAAEWWGGKVVSLAESSERGYVQVGRADRAVPFSLVQTIQWNSGKVLSRRIRFS